MVEKPGHRGQDDSPEDKPNSNWTQIALTNNNLAFVARDRLGFCRIVLCDLTNARSYSILGIRVPDEAILILSESILALVLKDQIMIKDLAAIAVLPEPQGARDDPWLGNWFYKSKECILDEFESVAMTDCERLISVAAQGRIVAVLGDLQGHMMLTLYHVAVKTFDLGNAATQPACIVLADVKGEICVRLFTATYAGLECTVRVATVRLDGTVRDEWKASWSRMRKPFTSAHTRMEVHEIRTGTYQMRLRSTNWDHSVLIVVGHKIEEIPHRSVAWNHRRFIRRERPIGRIIQRLGHRLNWPADWIVCEDWAVYVYRSAKMRTAVSSWLSIKMSVWSLVDDSEQRPAIWYV